MTNIVKGFNDPGGRTTFQAFIDAIPGTVNPMINVAAAKFDYLYPVGNINQVFLTGPIKIMTIYDYFHTIHIKKERYVYLADITKIEQYWCIWNDSIRAWQGGGELITGDPKKEHNEPYLLQSLRSLIYLTTGDLKTIVSNHTLPIVKTLYNLYKNNKDFRERVKLAIKDCETEPGELAILYYLESSGKELSHRAFTTLLYNALTNPNKISAVYSIPIIKMLIDCINNNVKDDIIINYYNDLLSKQTQLPEFLELLCQRIPKVPSPKKFLESSNNKLSIIEAFPELFGKIDLNPFKLQKLNIMDNQKKEYKYPTLTKYCGENCITTEPEKVASYAIVINPDNFEHNIKLTLELPGISNCNGNQTGKIISIEEENITNKNMIDGTINYIDGTISKIINIDSTSLTVDIDKEFNDQPMTIVFDTMTTKFFRDFSISDGVVELSLFNQGILFTSGLSFMLIKDTHNNKQCLRFKHNSDKNINICLEYKPLTIKFQYLAVIIENKK